MQGRRSSAAFTIVVTVVMLIGAAVMGLVLLLSGAPGALVVGLVLAALPVAPLIACYMWLDRYEPEPRSLLVLGLGWGAFVATSGALVLQLFDSVIFETDRRRSPATVVAPVTEEAAKGLFILLLLFYRRHELDGILDGLVYAGMVGIGFAFTENILYLTSAYMGEDGQAGGIGGAVGLFIVRCVFGPFAHPFFTAFIGIGIGIAVGSPEQGGAGARAGDRLPRRGRRARRLERLADARRRPQRDRHLLLPDGPGLPPAERLRGLVAPPRGCGAHRRAQRLRAARLPRPGRDPVARRGSRPAASPGGTPRRSAARPARRTMVAYQNEAVELGFLHSRFLRGVPPPDFAEIGQEHVDADARAATRAALAPADRRPATRADADRPGGPAGRTGAPR